MRATFRRVLLTLGLVVGAGGCIGPDGTEVKPVGPSAKERAWFDDHRADLETAIADHLGRGDKARLEAFRHGPPGSPYAGLKIHGDCYEFEMLSEPWDSRRAFVYRPPSGGKRPEPDQLSHEVFLSDSRIGHLTPVGEHWVFVLWE